MPRPEVNIVVCVGPKRCSRLEAHGRDGVQLLEGLTATVRQHDLEHRVQVTPCRCIFGCSYGPRIDVARRWSGDKVLYGTVEGEVTISVRGAVKMTRLPPVLLDLVLENLPAA